MGQEQQLSTFLKQCKTWYIHKRQIKQIILWNNTIYKTGKWSDSGNRAGSPAAQCSPYGIFSWPLRCENHRADSPRAHFQSQNYIIPIIKFFSNRRKASTGEAEPKTNQSNTKAYLPVVCITHVIYKYIHILYTHSDTFPFTWSYLQS